MSNILSADWAVLSIALLLLIALFVYYRFSLRKMKNHQEYLKGVVAEKKELLKYAVINEQRALEEAAVNNRSKRELLSKIIHEIRTPMNVMWGMASLINETKLNNEQREYCDTLLKSGEELISKINDILTKDILQYSQIDSAQDLDSKNFNLRDTIEEVLDVLAPKAATKGLDLLYKIDSKVPAQIAGDALRIRQILMNLVENAFRFTTKGEIFITVDISAYTINGPILQFEVKDSGKGMTQKRFGEISTALAVNEDLNDNQSGLGLTLAICKKLVTLMGGEIRVESAENTGTTFRFTIAVAKGQSMNMKKELEINNFHGKKALIIDENEVSANIIKEQLGNWGIEALTAGDANSALAIMKKNTNLAFCVIDFAIANREGMSLTHELKKTSEIAMLLMHKSHEVVEAENKRLFKSNIIKPIRLQNLAKVINETLNNTSGVNSGMVLSSDFAQKNPLNILIAEDDAMNQQMIKMVLKKLGYDATIVTNGKEVLEEVGHGNYDLILMDIQMPEMDGLEATKMIRLCLNSQPIIVAMTTNSLQGDKEECLAAGMNDYISKPVNLQSLIKILEKWATHTHKKNSIELRA